MLQSICVAVWQRDVRAPLLREADWRPFRQGGTCLWLRRKDLRPAAVFKLDAWRAVIDLTPRARSAEVAWQPDSEVQIWAGL